MHLLAGERLAAEIEDFKTFKPPDRFERRTMRSTGGVRRHLTDAGDASGSLREIDRTVWLQDPVLKHEADVLFAIQVLNLSATRAQTEWSIRVFKS